MARRAGLAGKTDLEFVQADMVCLLFEILITFWFYSDYLLVLFGSFIRYNIGCLPL